MKKILILYATYGSGHKTIAEYIKKHFEESGQYECLAIDLISYSLPAFGTLTKKSSEFLMTKLPLIWSIFYYAFNNKLTAYISGNMTATLFNNKKLKKVIREFNPDITIATHFYGTDLISNYNKKYITNSKIVTIITDYHAHNFWLTHLKEIDAIVVGNVEEKIYLLTKGFKTSQIHTTGIPISPNFGENLNKDKILKKLKINNNKKNVLFFVGGGNGAMFNLIYFKEILKNKYDCNVLFIAGKNKNAYKKAKEYVKRYNSKNVKVFGFINNVNEFYKISDFVVTKPGGAQVTECLFFNKPMLLIKSNGGQEISNRNYLCRSGYAKKARNKRKFNKNFELMLNDVHLNKMVKKISKINHKSAMDKLFKIVEKL